jgi:hypothetical protein
VVLVSLRGESDDDRATAADAVVTAIGSAAYDGITIDAVFTDSLLRTDGTPSPAAELFASLR